MKDEKVRPQLNIEIPAELEEVYSNLAVIAHSSSEFVFDFIRVMPNTPALISSGATAIARDENVDEETFNKYYQYASQDIFPKALIVRKVLADINAYIGTGECLKDRIMTVPPRILKSSIDFSETQIEDGDKDRLSFSNFYESDYENKIYTRI